MKNNMPIAFLFVCLMFINFGFVQNINAKANSLSLHTFITSTSVDTTKQELVANPTFGIDISHHNNNIVNLLSLKGDSISFVICKATEGVTYTDPHFFDNWSMIKEKGLIRGAYHFYRTNDDPINQAQLFCAIISDRDSTDLPPVIDFENGSVVDSDSISSIQSNLIIFINEIEQRMKVKPIIYTSPNCANKYLNNAFFSQYSLWIADYSSVDTPRIPNIWSSKPFLIWQRTDDYSFDNYTLDADLYNGSLKELRAFINSSVLSN
jgi:lysozyme